MNSSTATTFTTEEGLEIVPDFPNELLDYFYQQQFMEDLDVPFVGGSSLSAVSHTTSFEDDVVILGTDDIFHNTPHGGSDTTASLKASGCDETMFVGEACSSSDTAAAAAAAAATVIIPEISTGASNNSHVDLSPKSGIAKQVKRRSRASRRTPTTLLNASIKNFRTVVQQYTGCHSSNSGFHRNGKGPITLSFGSPKNDFPVSFSSYYDAHEKVDRQAAADDQLIC